MKIYRIRKAAAFVLAMSSVILAAAPVSEKAQAAQSDSAPKIKVEEPQEDISHKLVTSASNYYDLSLNDELSKAPNVLDAAGPSGNDPDQAGEDAEDASMRVDMTEDEIYMFASEVYCEAGNESFESQVGVAQVIINRILSPRYPDTLEGVLYQSGQFPPATNGFMDSVMASGEGNACRSAVMAALHGADVVGSYLYFNMTSGVDFSIVTSSMTIDGTTFYSLAE